MADRKPDLQSIFCEAIELDSPEAVSQYLDEVCRGDLKLRADVQTLLNNHAPDAGFLGGDSGRGCATIDYNITGLIGTTIGPYKLREQIGEGGMGVVYVAEQTEPLRRKVALKLVRPGMASRDVVGRFEAERQALAVMDHPNIAHVFDGGATDTGQPYFVMELVQGPAITEYCDQQRLSTRERLELFVQVCRAVHHAHQKGIIHRDLKPSNVLVPRIDGAAVPKVIDFGVAKAVGQKLTEQTVYTQFSQLVGTPLYMSPEQAELGVVDIDTRSDVYALGVLLYELLTGNTPFEKDTLQQAGLDEMRRMIREENPPAPSARLSTLADELRTTVAERRSADPRQLSQTIHGELDWIVMKALEKDRNRRYESANAMAADVRRYLNHEPVEAHAPSVTYQMCKFVRRHRVALAVAASLLLAILVGTAGTATGWVRAVEAEADARRDAVAAVRERQRAKTLLARMQLERGVDKLSEEDHRGLLDLVDACASADENPELRAAAGRLWAIAQQGAESRLVHTFPTNGPFGYIPDGRPLVTAGPFAFSPDGRLLVTANERQAQLWDVATGKAVGEPLQHEQPLDGVLFSPDGARLATITSQATARLWDVHTHRQVGPSMRHDPVREGHADWNTLLAAFSPDGKLFATGVLDVPVRLWDATTGDPRGKPLRPAAAFTALAFSPDGQRLATASEDGVAQLWDVASGEPIRQPLRPSLNPLKQGVIKVAFSPDGKLLASAYGNVAAVWETETGRQQSLCGGGRFDAGWLLDIAFSSDGARLATASTDWTARLWDVDSGEAIGAPMQHRGRARSVTFDTAGKLIATGSQDGTVHLWDAHRGEPLGPPIRHAGVVRQVAFSPDGKLLAASSGADTRIWRIDRSVVRPPVRISSTRRKTALSPDGRYRAAITAEHTVEVTDVATGNSVMAPIRDNRIKTVAFSPDSQLLATGSWNYTAKIWEATTGRLRQTLGCGERVYAVAFSPDGKTLATGLFNGTILLWDYAAGKRIGLPMRHLAPVWHVAFSPGGELLASTSGVAGHDDELWFWDVSTGPDYAGLRAPHVELAPDELLETFNLDGALRLAEPNGGERVWVLPQSPSELREMRLASWVALGLEHDLAGQVKAISVEQWRAMREEMNSD